MLEAERKGEFTRGREVIRVVPTQDENPTQSSSSSGTGNQTQTPKSTGPFKLLLQDWKGTTVWGVETSNKRTGGEGKIGYPPAMNLGAKIMLKKGIMVARGMVLLREGENCVVLGGKVEGLDKAWKEGREERLRAKLKADNEAASRNRNGG